MYWQSMHESQKLFRVNIISDHCSWSVLQKNKVHGSVARWRRWSVCVGGVEGGENDVQLRTSKPPLWGNWCSIPMKAGNPSFQPAILTNFKCLTVSWFSTELLKIPLHISFSLALMFGMLPDVAKDFAGLHKNDSTLFPPQQLSPSLWQCRGSYPLIGLSLACMLF